MVCGRPGQSLVLEFFLFLSVASHQVGGSILHAKVVAAIKKTEYTFNPIFPSKLVVGH